MEEIKIPIDYNNLKLSVSTFVKKVDSEWIIIIHGLQSNKNKFTNFTRKIFFLINILY